MIKVLVLSTCDSDGKKLLWCMREAGHRAYAMGNVSVNPSLRRSPLSAGFFAVPERFSFERRSPEIIPLIAAAVERERIDVVIPSGYESVKFISQHRDSLLRLARVMTVPSLEMIGELGNKRSFALFCERHGIPHPRTILLERADDVLRDGLPMSFPLMTKPFGLASGRGIRRFEDRRTLHGYLTAPREDGVNALPLLLQEFIPGEDFDFSGFCVGGRLAAWTIQRFLTFDGDVRWRRFERHDEILRIALRIIELARYDGPINVDFRVDSRDGGVKAIEVNPRFWATTVAAICDGVNYGDVGVRLAFDGAYATQPRCSNRIWGMPRRLPGMLLRHGGREFYAGLSRHTLFQFKYLLLDAAFSLASSVRSRFAAGDP
jgi:hypothetical protein